MPSRRDPSFDPNQFAYYQGDPNGDMTFPEEMVWAQNYLNAHPDWTGNDQIGVKDGQVVDNRSWLDKHTDALIAAGMAGTGAVGLLSGAFGAGAGAADAASSGATAGGAGSVGAGSTVAAGAGAGAGTSAAGAGAASAAATGAKMAIDPFWGELITAGIKAAGDAAKGSSLQQRQSFKGTAADPVQVMAQILAAEKGIGASLTNRANQGTTLHGTAPNPAGFAEDPAVANPNLLKYPGLGLDLTSLFGSKTPTGAGTGANTDPSLPPTQPGDASNRGGRAGGVSAAGSGVPPTANGTSTPMSYSDIMRLMTDPTGEIIDSLTKKKAGGNS